MTPDPRRFLATADWKQALRHVLCPARVHLPERLAHDFAGLFLHSSSPEKTEADLQDFKALCPVPPLLCADIESGPGRLPESDCGFPNMSGCGAVGDECLAYEMGRSAAAHARSQHVNWALAPVADLALDIDSPMVGARAAGASAELAARSVCGYLRGLQDHGVAATVKHFPGDGFSSIDQHNATPVNRMSREEWMDTYGRTFRAAIDAGVRAMMPGHIALAWADVVDRARGVEPPATVSRNVLSRLLREELGFAGVIVSDAMGMGGIAGFMHPYEAVAAFLEAGGDCVLFARYDAFFEREMERCLRAGLLTEETLYDRASRILALKEQIGLGGSPRPSMERSEESSRAVDAARRMTDACLQIVRDREDLLPLQSGKRLLHLVLCNDYEENRDLMERFGRAIEPSAASMETWVDPGPEKLLFALRDQQFDAVIVSLANMPSYGTNVIRLHGPVARNMMDGWMHLGVPVVWVQHRHPFHHRQYPSAMGTVINTYGSTNPYALRKVADGIFGYCDLNKVLHET